MSKINPAQIGSGVNIIISGGITAEQHQALNQLIHLMDNGPATGFVSGAYRETVGQPFPTNITWYIDNIKSKKIIEKIIIRNNIHMPIIITWNVYNIDGVSVMNTVSDTITYINNIFEISRVREIL